MLEIKPGQPSLAALPAGLSVRPYHLPLSVELFSVFFFFNKIWRGAIPGVLRAYSCLCTQNHFLQGSGDHMVLDHILILPLRKDKLISTCSFSASLGTGLAALLLSLAPHHIPTAPAVLAAMIARLSQHLVCSTPSSLASQLVGGNQVLSENKVCEESWPCVYCPSLMDCDKYTTWDVKNQTQVSCYKTSNLPAVVYDSDCSFNLFTEFSFFTPFSYFLNKSILYSQIKGLKSEVTTLQQFISVEMINGCML